MGCWGICKLAIINYAFPSLRDTQIQGARASVAGAVTVAVTVALLFIVALCVESAPSYFHFVSAASFN